MGLYLSKNKELAHTPLNSFIEIPMGAESAYLYHADKPWSYIEFYRLNDTQVYWEALAR